MSNNSLDEHSLKCLREWYAAHAKIINLDTFISMEYMGDDELSQIKEEIGSNIGIEAVRAGVIDFASQPDSYYGTMLLKARATFLIGGESLGLTTELERLQIENQELARQLNFEKEDSRRRKS